MLKTLNTILISRNTKYHYILEALYNRERSCPGHWYYGSKGLDFETFEANFKFEVSEVLLDGMFVNGYIRWGNHTITKKKTVCLTNTGIVCFVNRSTLKNIWYRSRDFWISIFALLIAIIGFLKDTKAS